MKKLWKHYSYAIILMGLSCSFAIVLSLQSFLQSQDKYMKVTISQGDSLWKIAQQYSDRLSISNEEFVNWVKRHNYNAGDTIYPGDVIMIPVTKESPAAEQFASGFGK
ncbi:cell division suppressor protein YneA [Neobacillus fumarioli]|uniref:cell division suppressor protein YneA n=1 Tax=Neobacillus fumarioli TaxID=105229 RepID=UPI000832A55F|nr:LysM peptidoglycan-binding domain-containing protein [Neobacillus fumarioli]